MHRTARSLFLPLTLGLVFATPFLGCQQSGGTSGGNGGSTAKGGSGGGSGGSGGTTSSGGSTARGGSGGGQGGTTSSGGTTGSGGTTARGGSGGTTGSGGTAGSGGTTARGGSGGTTVNGGAGGSGGTTAGGAGGGQGGTTGSGGTTGGGGTTTAGGATGGGGTTGGGGSTAGGDMISDFENTPGKADMIKSGGRTGYWYVYFPESDTVATPASGMSISPALVNGAPVNSATDGSNNALHFTGSGYDGTKMTSGGWKADYAGTGAAFKPHAYPDKASDAYDSSAYTGISFKMKQGGSSPPPALYVEVITKESQPAAAGGTATVTSIDQYNTRGHMMVTPWIPTAISSGWQTFTIPFGTLIPRWLPAAGSGDSACPAAGSGPKCQAPPFKPANVLGIQFSFYGDPGWPTVSGATKGTFDIWIDDVQFTKDDSGLQKRDGFPLADSGSWGSCIMPKGASVGAKYLVPAYNAWKKTFVSGGKVIRPENGNDTVSEGIAYGMLIAVNMKDKELFDQLYSYWKSQDAGGNLMTWCIPAGSNSCSASGGSATDADEDAAFALLQADKVFGGGTYKSDAMAMIGQIWAKDIDAGATNLPKGGSNYQSPTGSGGLQITNPSYFAPSFYTAFKAAGDTHDWASVNSAVYTALGKIGGSNGLVPAWCGSTCSSPASNGGANDMNYQYDSHRTPMRIALDYCWNGTAAAKEYVTKTTSFFANQTKDGMGRVPDMFTPSGGAVSGTAPNSASIIGTAAVGAMAAGNQAFLDDAYQLVFDSTTRATLAVTDTAGKTPYSYYNATVGMLTLLIMTGNFSH